MTVVFVPVTSSNIVALGYEAGKLYARFRGGTYEYDDVPPEVFDRLLAVDADPHGSVGSAFNEMVKRAGFPYRKLELEEAA